MSETKQTISIPERIIIRDLAQKLQKPVTEVIAKLMMNGILSSQNEEIDFDTASIIASEFGFEATQDNDATASGGINIETLLTVDAQKAQARPPVVVVMGHVDHGKTKLLDAIRATNVMASEAGGITQHIGAYQAKEKNRLITLIDTPGHEAFTAMRSRGAKVADIAILVVAADDGIQPQTEEAIQIIRAAGLSFLVAVTKIDKPEADIERIKTQLSEHDLTPEDWGGKTIVVPVSAQQRTNLNDLLDMILLVADIDKDSIVADPAQPAVGTIIESHVDRGEGPVATVVIQNGTLHVGDVVKVGDVWGKIKGLKDDHGKSVTDAPPSMPVRVLGLKGSPTVGDILQATNEQDVKSLKKKKQYRHDSHMYAATAATSVTKKQVEDAAETEPKEKVEKKILKIVLKADTLGSLEAIKATLDKFQHEEVGVNLVTQGLGNITEADVLSAETNGALLRGFNVRVSPAAEKVAKGKDIEIKNYSVIYDLIDEVREKLESMLSPEILFEVIGTVHVLAIFRTTKRDMIIGGRVESGEATIGATVRVKRGDAVIADGKITALQSNKVDAKKVSAGRECGMKFSGSPVIQQGDRIEFVKRKEILKKLDY